MSEFSVQLRQLIGICDFNTRVGSFRFELWIISPENIGPFNTVRLDFLL